MITLRRASAGDARAIRRMILAARLDPSSLKWQNFLLAVDDANGGALIGCAQIKRYADCNEFGSLVVLPSHRKHGIGGQLLRALVDAEPGPVWLVCVRRMEPYYQRFGFVRQPFRALPLTLKVKQAFGRLFGIGVVVMKKGGEGGAEGAENAESAGGAERSAPPAPSALSAPSAPPPSSPTPPTASS